MFAELTSEKNNYIVQAMDIDLPEDQFITEDEILSVLGRGSQISYGKERIYNYLTDASELHNTQDKINFLRNEYGIGGRGRTPGHSRFLEIIRKS